MSFYRDFNEKAAAERWNTRQQPTFKTIEVKPIAWAGGAEVSGVDLRQPLTPEQFEELQKALAEYLVLVFRRQPIDTAQHKAFGQRWGRLHRHVSAAKRAPGGDPEVLAWKTGKDSRFTAGEAWHNDVSCDPTPITASILRLTRTPALGGDTAFANTHLLYESLSTPFKALIEPLSAEHSGREGWTNGYGEEPEPGQTYASHVHPVVIRHPLSGRRHLFVNRGFTTHIQELTRAESQSVLEALYRHIETQLAAQFRVAWAPDTVVMWDNWGVQHQAVWDYYPQERWGERVSAVSGLSPTRA
jgi:taurine dioxygenase